MFHKQKIYFLDAGMYDAELCVDGVNAETNPSDYVIKNFTIEKDKPLHIKWLQAV